MGYRIELWTEHEDNGAAIDALATRVGEDSLTLTSGEDVPAGEWVAFEVKLADGSVFLEGMGRCQGSISKDPLFDVELRMLQLETRDQMLFERILLAADDLASGARTTGEVDLAELEAKDAKDAKDSKEAKPAKPPPPPPKLGAKGPPVLPPKKAAKKEAPEKQAPKKGEDGKKKWPWQKTTEPGMPSPEPDAADSKASRPAPPLPSKPPPAPSKSPMPSSAPPRPNVDPPLSPALRQRLMNIVPTLVAEGRVRDMAGAHELALQIGLQALETFLDEDGE